jgi:hypothetical protein
MAVCEHKFSTGEQCDQEAALYEHYCKDHLADHQYPPPLAQPKGPLRRRQINQPRRSRPRGR